MDHTLDEYKIFELSTFADRFHWRVVWGQLQLRIFLLCTCTCPVLQGHKSSEQLIVLFLDQVLSHHKKDFQHESDFALIYRQYEYEPIIIEKIDSSFTVFLIKLHTPLLQASLFSQGYIRLWKQCMRHYVLQLSYTDNLINSGDMKLIYSKLNYMYYATLIND